MARAVPGKAHGIKVNASISPLPARLGLGGHPRGDRGDQHAERRPSHRKQQAVLQRAKRTTIRQVRTIIIQGQQLPRLRARNMNIGDKRDIDQNDERQERR